MNEPPSPAPAQRRFRWWPAAAIVLLALGFWIWIWVFKDTQRQDKNLQTMMSGLAVAFALLLWWVCFSRCPWRRRLWIAGSTMALVGLGVAMLEVKGVTGDLLPILQWRWKKSSSRLVAPPTAQAAQRAVPRRAANPESDYPQILGATRDGHVKGITLERDWRRIPPRELWRLPMGAAWSGFAIADDRAITLEQYGPNEVTTCRDLLTGQLLWAHQDATRYATTIAGEGPRTVPTVVSNSVFTLGATGKLNCLAIEDGALRWTKSILEDNQSSMPGWGVSGSPLVYDDFLVVHPGGTNGCSLVAYHAITGERLWAGGDHDAGYSSPVLATLAGVRQVLIFDADSLTSYDASSGKRLWKYPWRRGHPHVTMPVLLPNDRVLVSSGYGTGSEVLQVRLGEGAAWSVQSLWKSNRLKSKFANLIVRDAHVYGLDDGTLVCLDLADGTLKWKEGRYGHGQMILVQDLLLIMAEDGDLVLVEPVPEAPRELARFHILDDKTWNPPALAGAYLLVRNDKEAACVQLPIRRVQRP